MISSIIIFLVGVISAVVPVITVCYKWVVRLLKGQNFVMADFEERQCSPPAPKFVVSEYLARIEKVHLDIERKKANREDYVIILWLGLNGLRVSDCEWIKREEDLAGSGGTGGMTDYYTAPLASLYWAVWQQYNQNNYTPYPYTQLMDTQSLAQQQVNVAHTLQTQMLMASLNTAVDFTGTQGGTHG